MTIQDIIKTRNIQNVVHFTRIENLENILINGVIPRERLGEDAFQNDFDVLNKGKYIYNDNIRLDGKRDYSCFSISFPNDKMFYKLRKNNPNSNWAVLYFSTEILVNFDCLFYPCNAADSRVKDEDIQLFKDSIAFEKMFDSENREPYLKDKYPTDVQAEVLVKDTISPDYIKGIILHNEGLYNEYVNKFPNFKFKYYKDGSKVFATRRAYCSGH